MRPQALRVRCEQHVALCLQFELCMYLIHAPRFLAPNDLAVTVISATSVRLEWGALCSQGACPKVDDRRK